MMTERGGKPSNTLDRGAGLRAWLDRLDGPLGLSFSIAWALQACTCPDDRLGTLKDDLAVWCGCAFE